MAMCTLLLSLLCVNAIPDLERTLDAICAVESSSGKDKTDGDGGRAIGPYQIHRSYWKDGTGFLKVAWPYEDARDPAKAQQVVRAYLLHYAPAAGPEQWARIHNGGPAGHRKAATLDYWAKVKAQMAISR